SASDPLTRAKGRLMEETQDFTTEFDTHILGLKYELISLLTEDGFGWFSDYTDVDCCLTESTISLRLLSDHRAIVPTLKKFCRQHGFSVGCFDRMAGRVTLVRSRKQKASVGRNPRND